MQLTNDFGQITETKYEDPLLRPIRSFAVNFTEPESQTIYDDNARTVKVRKQIDSVNWDEATTFADSLGRAYKTQATDSQGDIFVETHYDLLGRVDRVSNPYRANETAPEDVLWSKTRYDVAGRAVETYAPAKLADLATATSLGITSFGISDVTGFVGTVVSTKDASGRRGRSITNGLGQLIRVDEPTGIGASEDSDLGALATPVQPTSYKYDVFGKMVEVTQGVQKRWFKYDVLGRLLRVRQPEQEVNTGLNMSDAYNTSGQWTAGFAYDLMGNVVRATDANGVNIINDYDRAGRVIRRCYTKPNINTSATSCVGVQENDISTDTPAVTFWYDGKGLDAPQSPNYAKGKLTEVSNASSTTEYQEFDNLGRLKRTAQITDGNIYTSKYTYNFAGALIEEEYPSGRIVKNEYESDGDIARIFGSKNSSSPEKTFANTFRYTPDGKIESLRLGNGLWESAKFNNRMQPTEINLGHGVVSGDLWKLTYEYGELESNGTVSTTKNTGNIARQTVSFNGLSHPFVQSYKYDPLQRLTEAKETKNGSQMWLQQFGYDLYGNRISTNQSVNGSTITSTPAVDANTNRFTSTSFEYDKNGNITRDTSIANASRTFLFNADNKQRQVLNSESVAIGTYYYDGEGKRVKKVTQTETTVYVHSGGKLVAEYTNATPPPNPTVSYTATDLLGSPRVLTDSLGVVISRRDFLPFGEEVYADEANRTSAQKYTTSGDDGLRKRFTGYEKDQETQLDFAEARMYENRYGRFTAVDPLLASGISGNPQTFNRFVYVMNSPLRFNDPSGLQAGDFAGTVYTDPTKMHFSRHNAKGRIPYEEYSVLDATDGYRYYVYPNGWTQLGKTSDLIEDDISDLESVAIGFKSWANGLANCPLPVGPLGGNPFVNPSIASITGYQPFSDSETETKTWRDWGISTATQVGIDIVAAKGVGKFGLIGEASASRGGLFSGSRLFGSGPVAGVLEVSDRAKSVGAFLNYKPKNGIEFIFNTEQNVFLVGKTKSGGLLDSPHEKLAGLTGSGEYSSIVGGMFRRGANGAILTNEHSGHYWQNWNSANRKQFTDFMKRKTGQDVCHSY